MTARRRLATMASRTIWRRADPVAHIDLGVDEMQFPGISGPMRFRPEVAGPLNELANVVLRGPSTLSRGERELIAAYVSGLNGCRFCCSSHSAFAAAQLD